MGVIKSRGFNVIATMSVSYIIRARFILAPIAAACLLAACATGKVTTAPEAGPPAAPTSTDEPPAAVRPSQSAPQTAKPRPPRNDKDTRPVAPTAPLRSGSKDIEVIIEEAPPEPRLPGPGWLSQCISRQMEGGVILCDADRLLATPSARVKVFTRDPAAAGRMSGGSIQVRANLPRRYRFFVVP